MALTHTSLHVYIEHTQSHPPFPRAPVPLSLSLVLWLLCLVCLCLVCECVYKVSVCVFTP